MALGESQRSDRSQEIVPVAAKVSESAFRAIFWIGCAFATLFILARFFLRFRTLRRLYVDDGLICLAWLTALGLTILWQVIADDLYLDLDVSTFRRLPPPDYIARMERYRKASTAFFVLFHTILLLIKLSFLIFFHRLFLHISTFRRFWWVITAFTVVSWCVCVGIISWSCLLGPIDSIRDQCLSAAHVHRIYANIIVSCSLDVASDLMIIALPVSILWRVRVSPRQKIGLIILFSVTMITIASSLVRMAVSISRKLVMDMAWFVIWGGLEIYIALIVACLGSFRSLFQAQGSSANAQPPASRTAHSPPSPWRLWGRFSSVFSQPTTKGGGDTLNKDDADRILGLYSHSRNNDSSFTSSFGSATDVEMPEIQHDTTLCSARTSTRHLPSSPTYSSSATI